ncbi:MAG TPA: hypothetical protein VIM07_17715 [Chitinophagaceae bacterium]
MTTTLSCKKNVDNSLIGDWQWTKSIGGIAANTVTPSSTTIVTLKLNNDLTYTTYINNQKQEQGQYYLSTNQNYTIITFSKTVVVDKLILQNDQMISKIENGKMTLFDNSISDGYGHYFDKIK